jgi:hypothetical protein
MSKKLDFTQVAFNVAMQATGEAPRVPAPKPKGTGKAVGGAKRMASLTPDERKELALKAAGARWAKSGTAPSPSGTGAAKLSKGR